MVHAKRWWRTGRHQSEVQGVLRQCLAVYERPEPFEVFTKPASTALRNQLDFLGWVRKGVGMVLGTLPGRWLD